MLKPLDVERFLRSEGFVQLGMGTTRKLALKSEYILEPMYVSRLAGKSPSSLILHPKYSKHLIALCSIEGVVSHHNEFYHSSNMSLFPKRKHRGETLIHYGVPFGFRSESGLQKFLELLIDLDMSRQSALEEIANAEAELQLLPETTRQTVIQARLGQGAYRDRMLGYWEGCAVTGLTFPQMLVASHAKPWAKSSNDERLDHFNGLLLCPNLDMAFDQGFISFDENGSILISKTLPDEFLPQLGINPELRLRKMDPRHETYMAWHRQHIFES